MPLKQTVPAFWRSKCILQKLSRRQQAKAYFKIFNAPYNLFKCQTCKKKKRRQNNAFETKTGVSFSFKMAVSCAMCCHTDKIICCSFHCGTVFCYSISLNPYLVNINRWFQMKSFGSIVHKNFCTTHRCMQTEEIPIHNKHKFLFTLMESIANALSCLSK